MTAPRAFRGNRFGRDGQRALTELHRALTERLCSDHGVPELRGDREMADAWARWSIAVDLYEESRRSSRAMEAARTWWLIEAQTSEVAPPPPAWDHPDVRLERADHWYREAREALRVMRELGQQPRRAAWWGDLGRMPATGWPEPPEGLAGDVVADVRSITAEMPSPAGARREERTAPRRLEVRELRAAEDGRRVIARVLNYDVLDDYGTMFAPGCFAESLAQRLPTFAWSHDWAEPIGRAVSYDDTADGLTIEFELDDPAAVPRAAQALEQLRSGTLSEFSVGFRRLADEEVPAEAVGGRRGVYRITKGQLDEVSVVLRGAVPGTALVGMRRPKPAALRGPQVAFS